MGLCHRSRWLRAALLNSHCPLSDPHPVISSCPVYLKPSRSSRRKPSYVVSRMRDPVPSYAYKAPPLGSAAPLFCVTSPSCEYFALRLPLVKAGFRRPASPDESVIPCNVMWGRSLSLSGGGDSAHSPGPLRAALASPHQRFNHFPSSHGALGCKWGMTKQLRRAARGLTNSESAAHYNFLPRTWLYPDEGEALMRAFADAPPTQRFIWKPARGSCGRGIFTSLGGTANESTWRRVVDEVERRVALPVISATASVSASPLASRRYVVQEYLEDPLLLDKRKTDLRLYVAVTSYDPLTIYLHEEGLVRLAAQPYGAGGVKLNFDPFRDLTNYSIGKHWGTRDCQKQEGVADEIVVPDLKRSLADLWAHIDTVRPMPQPVSVAVRGEIARVIVKTLLAVKFPLAAAAAAAQRTSLPCGFFELYGFDVILDAKLKPWLVEVNTLPSLASTSPFDYAVKTNVVADLLNLAMIEPFERSAACFSGTVPSHAALFEPLSREAEQTVHRTGFDALKPLEKSEYREEVRQRLLDELAYCRGFRRIFPPLPGDDSVGGLVMSDIATLSRHNRLSLVDEWALVG